MVLCDLSFECVFQITVVDHLIPFTLNGNLEYALFWCQTNLSSGLPIFPNIINRMCYLFDYRKLISYKHRVGILVKPLKLQCEH